MNLKNEQERLTQERNNMQPLSNSERVIQEDFKRIPFIDQPSLQDGRSLSSSMPLSNSYEYDDLVNSLQFEVIRLNSSKEQLEKTTQTVKDQRDQIKEYAERVKQLEKQLSEKEAEIQQLQIPSLPTPIKQVNEEGVTDTRDIDNFSFTDLSENDFTHDLPEVISVEEDISLTTLYKQTLSELSQVKEELTTTQKDLLISTSQVTSQKETIQSLEKKIEMDTIKNQEVQKELAEAKHQLTELQLKVDDYDEQKQCWCEELKKVKKEQNENENEYNEYKRKMMNIEEDYSQLQQSYKELQEENQLNAATTQKYSALLEEYNNLKERLILLQEKQEEFKKQGEEQQEVIEKLQKELKELKKKYHSLYNDSVVLVSERKEIIEEKNRIQGLFDEQQKVLSTLQIKSRNMDDMKKQKEDDIEKLKKELKETQESLSIVQQELSTASEGLKIIPESGIELYTTNPKGIEEYVNSLNNRIISLEKQISEIRETSKKEIEASKEASVQVMKNCSLLKEEKEQIQLELEQEKVKTIELEKQLEKKEKEIERQQKSHDNQHSTLQNDMKEKFDEIQQSLVSSQNRVHSLEEEVKKAEVEIQNREKIIKNAKIINNKLKNNEIIYKQAIQELQARVTQREKELDSVYQSMKIMK